VNAVVISTASGHPWRAAEPEHREHIRLERPLEFIGRDLVDRFVRSLEGGVVDEDVEVVLGAGLLTSGIGGAGILERSC
jgi:hypothetical protein